MNQVQIFSKPEFGQVRTIKIDGKIHFIAVDIAKALGYTNPNKAINDHCRWVTKRDVPHPQSATKTIEVNVIPEGDIYRLVANSELPGAEKFESWIFDDVLPSIRKHGAYMTENTLEKALTSPDFLIQLATKLKEEQQVRIEAENQIERDKPKVIFAEAFEVSNSSILVGELAKILRQNGINIGQNRLFERLRKDGYLGNRGEYYNIPTQKSMDLGLFEIKTRTINNPDGSTRVTKTSKVTGKGQIYFVNKFKEVN